MLAARTGLWHRTVLPVLRDDLALARALRADAREGPPRPLPVPLLAVGADRDPLVDAAALDGWRDWTRHRFVRRTLPGDHFFQREPGTPRLIGRACRVAERLTGPDLAVPATLTTPFFPTRTERSWTA